jgi:mannosylglycerate hydrolase
MPTLHLVSHTHWDREWYLTFQQFRFKLVNLVDDLLHLMETDLNYKRFMLDGQTIILNDYLQIRPEREAELRLLIQEGRLLIGPWYVLPDEFLVSSEAIVRNLLEGMRISQHFGPRMKVGYIPDPFGHIGQMPQILVGFGIQTACLRRGLDDQPCELWWHAPDGTSILLAYLRDGYDNAAALPVSDLEAFVDGIKKIYRSLSHHCATSHVLLMQGTDHMFPQPGTSRAIAYANQHLGDDCPSTWLPFWQRSLRKKICPRIKGLPSQRFRASYVPASAITFSLASYPRACGSNSVTTLARRN